ncbi:hypothetical protein [Winogradskyella tangerina]|uniref:hypothetical protein n=1 Tax=Winogradskyella tangerina TaxID=2023240 RepID=UPI000DBE5DB2|nr:hypothetical protein [Winogradskyella tangerina]
MITSDKLKFFLLKTPFAKQIREFEGRLLLAKMDKQSPDLIKQRTVYCISPYKTGTTFLSSSFNTEVSRHEPIHFASYKYLDKDFDKYFVKRLNYLNLKLECSGSWSAYVEELAQHKTAKNLDYVCILRSPSSWITSVINYWNKPSMLKFYFDIPHEYFWKDKVGVNLREFELGAETDQNQEIINKLIDFYFDFTEKTSLLKNITYIRLKDIKSSLPIIEDLIDEQASPEDSWKRANNKKQFTYKNDDIDQQYLALTNALIQAKSAKQYVH